MEDFLGNMKVYEYRGDRVFVYSQLKRDGYAIQARKFADGTFSLNTREPTVYESEQEWYTKLKEIMPPDSCVLGELFVPGHESTDVRSVLAKEPTKIGQFEAFCMPRWEGRDYRRNNIEEIANYSNAIGLTFIPVYLGLSGPPATGDYEGYVLKTNQYPLFPHDWMKMKPRLDIDLRITGYTQAAPGKFDGLIGAVICESDDGKIKVPVSGMNDDWRKYFTDHGKVLLGSIVEIQAQKILRTGGLRHPRFKKLRDDKRTTSKLEDLL